MVFFSFHRHDDECVIITAFDFQWRPKSNDYYNMRAWNAKTVVVHTFASELESVRCPDIYVILYCYHTPGLRLYTNLPRVLTRAPATRQDVVQWGSNLWPDNASVKLRGVEVIDIKVMPIALYTEPCRSEENSRYHHCGSNLIVDND